MPPGNPLVRFLFGRAINAAVEAAVAEHLATISATVDDSAGWTPLTTRPGDRDASERQADIEDALTAWRKNFFIRRIVNLVRSYVIGGGMTISSRDPDTQAFITAFWNHRKNRIDRRLGPICNQLTRDGELFPILFTNPQTGISYVRFRTSVQIREVETLPNDWEEERVFVETGLEGVRWYAPDHPTAQHVLKSGKVHPVMLHWVINKPLDAQRGESDLTPVLPWAKRYAEWLADRVRLNRQRTRQAMMDVEVADDSIVEQKRQELRRHNPIEAGIYVHGTGEKTTYPSLQIEADDAAPDGLALRQAIATGSNLGLHYMGEGQGTNYATAKEMGEPVARFYSDRQKELIWMVEDLVTVAYQRYCLVRQQPQPDTLDLQISVTEVARQDNQILAGAALSIAQALAIAAGEAWIDDETALTLMLKFAGEALSRADIDRILKAAKKAAKAKPQPQPPQEEPDA